MSEKNEEVVARLERLNDDLKRSLRRCRHLVHDYQVMLAANSNEPRSLADNQETGNFDGAGPDTAYGGAHRSMPPIG